MWPPDGAKIIRLKRGRDAKAGRGVILELFCIVPKEFDPWAEGSEAQKLFGSEWNNPEICS